jgi:hypothetical protein
VSEELTFHEITPEEAAKGTHKPEDKDVILIVSDAKAMFGRRMFELDTGREIPFGTYPNIDWT